MNGAAAAGRNGRELAEFGGNTSSGSSDIGTAHGCGSKQSQAKKYVMYVVQNI